MQFCNTIFETAWADIKKQASVCFEVMFASHWPETQQIMNSTAMLWRKHVGAVVPRFGKILSQTWNPLYSPMRWKNGTFQFPKVCLYFGIVFIRKCRKWWVLSLLRTCWIRRGWLLFWLHVGNVRFPMDLKLWNDFGWPSPSNFDCWLLILLSISLALLRNFDAGVIGSIALPSICKGYAVPYDFKDQIARPQHIEWFAGQTIGKGVHLTTRNHKMYGSLTLGITMCLH